MGTWLNSDGLYIKTGQTEATVIPAGEIANPDRLHTVELTISALTGLTASAVIQADTVEIPAGARIEDVTVIAETAATSGGSATLNVGLIRTDRTTNVSDTQFVSALALTSIDAAGEKTILTPGSTGAGAGIGTTLANKGYFTAKYGTAAFTAGKVRILVRYYFP